MGNMEALVPIELSALLPSRIPNSRALDPAFYQNLFILPGAPKCMADNQVVFLRHESAKARHFYNARIMQKVIGITGTDHRRPLFFNRHLLMLLS